MRQCRAVRVARGLSALDPTRSRRRRTPNRQQRSMSRRPTSQTEPKSNRTRKANSAAQGQRVVRQHREGVARLNGGGDTGGASLEDVTLEKQGSVTSSRRSGTRAIPVARRPAPCRHDEAVPARLLLRVRMKLPGGQVEQNADLIEDDGTMVWTSIRPRPHAEGPTGPVRHRSSRGKGPTRVRTTPAGKRGSSGSRDDGGSRHGSMWSSASWCASSPRSC